MTNKAKHTPGPWRKGDLTYTSYFWWPVYGPNNVRLASVEAQYPEQALGEANARLIAAAPAMLEALKAVADEVCGALCPSVKRTGEEWAHVPRCEAIRAAIAQVEKPS